ncbi:MAG TPA: hypothetical protein VM695_05060, partial [Phycisphaerae bacterium]|nr:hypothetical protein [Phycisphaerae bacterium]
QFAWTNTLHLTDAQKRKAVESGQAPPETRPVQSGTATADRWGLVTVPQLQVTTARHRIVIQRR